MFNGGNFNQLRYNIGSESDNDIRLIETMYASFSSMVTTGGNVYIVQTANSAFGAESELSAGVHISDVNMSAAVNSYALGNVLYFIRKTLQEAFNTSSFCSEDVRIKRELEGVINNDAFISVNKRIIMTMDSLINGNAEIGVDYVTPSIAMASIMDAQVTSMSFDTEYMTLDITLQPGQEIVIDSDNFLVLVDGEDAIDKHSGIWPWLSRELYDMQISAGAISDLQTSILYVERFI